MSSRKAAPLASCHVPFLSGAFSVLKSTLADNNIATQLPPLTANLTLVTVYDVNDPWLPPKSMDGTRPSTFPEPPREAAALTAIALEPSCVLEPHVNGGLSFVHSLFASAGFAFHPR